MTPKTKGARRSPRGTSLTWRSGRAYWQRVHERLPGGRVVKSLGTRDADLASTYAAALNTLCERGDWGVLERWATDSVHITDVASAVREGDYTRLRRLNMHGVRLGEAVDAFLTRAEATVSERRVANIRSVVDGLLTAFGADYAMHELRTTEAEAFLHGSKSTVNRAWSAGTQIEARTICKQLWTFAMEREREEAEKTDAAVSIVRNPWRGARVPKRRRTRFAFCSPDEALRVISHPSTVGMPRRALMAIGFYAGLRNGEIRHLRPGIDVDLSHGVVRVQSRPAPIPWRPKTENGERDVPIPAEVVAIVEQHIELGFATDRYLFHAPGRDQPITSRTAAMWARDAYVAVGLRYGSREGDALTMHSARHSYATWLLSAGVPLATVARRLGDTEAVVLQTYSHTMPRDESRANEVVGRIARGLEV